MARSGRPQCEELNATLLSWRPRAGPQEHINGERDGVGD